MYSSVGRATACLHVLLDCLQLSIETQIVYLHSGCSWYDQVISNASMLLCS